MSKFGGIPIENTGTTSKFGGIPVNASAPEDNGSFLGDMKENFLNAIQSGKDLATGNYEDIGRTQPTPKTQALANKLFPKGYEGGVMEAINNLGNTDASDFSGALLEKFGNTPEGKALAVIGGLNPVYNAAGTAINRYVNPAIEDVTGVHPDNLVLGEMMLSPLGLKNAKNIQDPNISIAKTLYNKAKPMLADETSGIANIPVTPKAGLPKNMQKVYDRLRADYPDDAQFNQALASYQSSSGKTLLEAGGDRTKNLAEGAGQYPTGAAKASEFFDDAINNAGDKLKGSIKKNISSNELYYKSLDDIVTMGREKARPLYDEAFKSNQSVSSPLIDRILETPEGKSALAEAAKNIQNEMSRVAVPDKELTALAREVSDLGLMKEQKGGVASGLKLRTLDEVKKAMDGNINKAYRAGDEAEARRIIGLKKALVNELDAQDKTGAYAKARKTSGDYLSNKDAMESGLNFLREDPELVQRNINDFGPSEKTAYKAGVVKALRNEIDTKFDGQNVARFINKKSTREKLQAILPENEYQKFISDAKAVDNLYKLRNELTGNSRTSLRQIAREEFDNESTAVIHDIAQNGFIGTTRKGVINFVMKKFDGLSDKAAGEVADILYATDPKQKYQIVKQLTQQAKANTPKAVEAQNKLVAIYGTLDAVTAAKKGVLAGVVGEAGTAPQRLNVEINPSSGNQAPKVDLPQTGDTIDMQPMNYIEPQSNADGLIQKMIQVESGGNPNAKAKTSSASGLLQFTDGTWRKMVRKYGAETGITFKDKNNPEAQIAFGKLLTQENASALSNAIGREPSDGELYMAHFLGSKGAEKLIKAHGKGVPAARLFPEAAKANRNIFFDKSGKPRKVEDVYKILSDKIMA